MSAQVQQVAQKFVDGLYEDLAGLGMHDAVHVLAIRYGLNKADLRASIYRTYETEVPVVEESEDEPTDF